MSYPLVSIVIPTYNRAQELDRALKSVLCQTYKSWEVLVVDNHSIDNTDELISQYNDSRIKLFKIHNDGVIAASRNKGIQHASGKYVALLDSDDWWLSTKLEESVKYLEQGADVVYHDLFLVKKPNQKVFLRKTCSRKLTRPVFNDLIMNGNALNNSSVVICRNILNEINGFSENKDIVAAEDYDGWLRAAKVTDKFKKIQKTLGYYWLGGGNTSGLMRTIKVAGIIELLYAKEIIDINSFCHVYYYNYVKGRAYYLAGDFVEAKKYFDIVCSKKGIPFVFYLKIKLMKLLILLRGW